MPKTLGALVKFVLHHIPKTGGHSIVQSFRAVFGPDAVSIDKGDTPLVSTHSPAWELFALYPDRAHITILRDPIERIKSYVRYMRTVTDTPVGAQARRLPTSEFLRLNRKVDEFTNNRQTRQLGRTDYDSYYPLSPFSLSVALGRLRRMAWVGHTETLTEDLNGLFELVGEPNPGLPPQNVSVINRSLNRLNDWNGSDELCGWDNQLLETWAQQ